MRIGFVYDALYPYVSGGAERRYYELASRLSASHDVHYVTWQWWDGPAVIEMNGITFHGVGRPPALYGPDGKRRVREAAAFAARVVPLLLRQRWDVVDCSATPCLPLYGAWAATRLTRTRLIATWHEFWGDHWLEYLPERPIVARVARWLESFSRRLADRVVVVSAFTLRRMAARSDKRHVVISNGVDLAVYSDDGASKRGSEWDVTYIGRLIDEKRVDLLLEALAQLRDRRPAVRCVIVGEGPARATLEARAAALGLAERVRFLGRVDQARAIDILRDTRTLVMPSAREGFGMAVIEAMACGAVPIVVRGRHSAAADLVRDQVDGRICDASSDAIAASIDELLGSPETLAGMRREARSTAASFDWDAIALEMERAYQMGARVSPVSANAT